MKGLSGWRRIVAFVVGLMIMCAIIMGATVDVGAKDTRIREFVVRMYEKVLRREADEAGLADWIGKLERKEIDAAGLVKGFILGDEFSISTIDDYEYIDILYETFLDEKGEPEFKQNWVNSKYLFWYYKEFCLSNFFNYDAFTEICDEYGIEKGVINQYGGPVPIDLSRYVRRLFEVVYNDEYDFREYINYTLKVESLDMTPEDLAIMFFEGDAYMTLGKTDNDYVRDLYTVFFNRKPRNQDVATWVDFLNAGASRREVLMGFAESEEFLTIRAKFELY